LIKKGFLKYVMQAMVHGYERKENLGSKGV
jgi:hypothetical protein